jgi:hypothetical protein
VGYGTTAISKPDIGFMFYTRAAMDRVEPQAVAFALLGSCGVTTMLLEVEARESVKNLGMGFRRMTRNIVLTFEHSSTSDDGEYQRHLDRLLEQASNPLAKALIYSQKAKIRDLRARGLLQAKRTRIFVRYQITGANDRPKTSPLDHVMGFWRPGGRTLNVVDRLGKPDRPL